MAVIDISPMTTSQKDIATAMTGKWEFKNDKLKDGTSVCWVIIGKFVFTNDEVSKNHFPYDVVEWHTADGSYWGILK